MRNFSTLSTPFIIYYNYYLFIYLFHSFLYIAREKKKKSFNFFHFDRKLSPYEKEMWYNTKSKGDAKMIYLHVGAGKSIREKDVIGIFDMDTSTVSPVTRKLLSQAEKEKRTESPSYEIPKSFILYRAENGETKVCFSQFSSASLFGRMGKGSVR